MDLEKDLTELRALKASIKKIEKEIRDKQNIYNDKLRKLELLNSQPALPQNNNLNGQTYTTESYKPATNRPITLGKTKDHNAQPPKYLEGPGSRKAYDEMTRSIFVAGNLAVVSQGELLKYFGQFGKIVNTFKPKRKVVHQVVFIKYETYDAADKAIRCKKHSVVGVALTVKKAKDF